MVEESPPVSPPAEESIEAETDTALEPELELGEPVPDASSEPGFVCACEEWMRSACNELPFFKEHESRSYCVLHYPGKEKSADFKAALDIKLTNEDFDFRGVWFPDEVDFRSFEFSADADFSNAQFRTNAYFDDATFSANARFSHTAFSADANFNLAKFVEFANFSEAKFGAKARFLAAKFSANAGFRDARFSADASFCGATFGANAFFGGATFSGDVDFSYAVFHDHLRFSGTQSFGRSSLDFQFVRVEKPDRVSFHSVKLHPHWLVNVDPRDFAFIDVSWEWTAKSIEREIQNITNKNLSSPHHLLAIACGQLAENAEANNRYEEASRFRYWVMELARHDKWKGASFWETDWLYNLYWAVSGYGERIVRALVVLVAVWIVFALLYTRVGFAQQPPRASNEGASSVTAASTTIEDRIGQPLELSRALTYSLAVMSLQKPEPRPLTNWAHTLVTLETILGPVQAALLALAIRRKFMR